MDPLSILALAGSAAKATYQTSATLYRFIEGAKNIDRTIKALLTEVVGLNRLLDAIGIALNNPAIESERARSEDNAGLWSSVVGALDDCRQTVQMLDKKVSGSKGHVTRQNIFKRSVSQLKLNVKDDDIRTLRFQIHAHTANLQVALQMINVLICALSPNRIIDEIGSKVESLTRLLTEQTLSEGDEMGKHLAEGPENAALRRHTKQLRQSATFMLSHTDTVFQTGALGMGEWEANSIDQASLPPEYRESADWDQDSTHASTEEIVQDYGSSSHEWVDASDSDDEVEHELAQKMFEKGEERFGQHDFAEAETFFRNGLRHVQNMTSKTSVGRFDLELVRLKLVAACQAQEKWDDAELMLLLLTNTHVPGDRDPTHTLGAYHALAQIYLCKYNFESAQEYCRKAMTGRKRLFGKQHPSYLASARLLALIYEANGDPTAAGIYTSKMPGQPGCPEDDAATASIIDRFSKYSTAEHLCLSLEEKKAAMAELSEGGWNPETGSGSVKTVDVLRWVASQGKELSTRWLLARGFDTENRNRGGETALTVAAYHGHTVVVRRLLDAGADISAGDNQGRTGLMWASLWGHEATVRVLLDGGADVNSRELDLSTPLISATQKNEVSIASLLLDRGADIEAKTKAERSALHYAARDGYDKLGRLLLEKGAKVEEEDEQGKTPLLYAADARDETMMKLLLERGARTDVRDANGSTPLYLVSGSGRAGILQLLLKHGAQVDGQANSGETPLMNAVSWGREESVRVLLKSGADVNAAARGNTALATAKAQGHPAVASLLQAHGGKESIE